MLQDSPRKRLTETPGLGSCGSYAYRRQILWAWSMQDLLCDCGHGSPQDGRHRTANPAEAGYTGLGSCTANSRRIGILGCGRAQDLDPGKTWPARDKRVAPSQGGLVPWLVQARLGWSWNRCLGRPSLITCNKLLHFWIKVGEASQDMAN